MPIKVYKPTSPGRRGMTGANFDEITKATPEKSLLREKRGKAGRNNSGKVTVADRGGQLVRSAGTSAQLIGREDKFAQIRLPSGELRVVREECMATIGQVGNQDHSNVKIGKAGRYRWMGWRPHVRGSAMDPASHPHGGGEGRSPIGMPGPKTPWGKPALGKKTRQNKRTDQYIIRRRGKKR